MFFCPFAAATRAAFLTDLTIVLERQIPFGTSTSSSDNRGLTLAYYPYTQGPFVGSVTLSAAPAGTGFEIVLTLEERRAG